MNSIKLLTKIFYDFGDSHKHIITFYEKEPVNHANLEKFINICGKHYILNEPSILFHFLDFNDIKVAVHPVINSDEWGYRIHYGKQVKIYNDYSGRVDATIGALEAAFALYYETINVVNPRRINNN